MTDDRDTLTPAQDDACAACSATRGHRPHARRRGRPGWTGCSTDLAAEPADGRPSSSWPPAGGAWRPCWWRPRPSSWSASASASW